MKIKDIMSKSIVSCNSNSTIYEVADMMKKYNIGFIPIIDNNIKGVITDRDIVIKCLYNKDKNILPYINQNIISIEENEEINNALKLMQQHKIKRLIITKDKKTSGILSLSDILTYYNNNNILDCIKTIYEISNHIQNKNNEIDDFYL